MNRPIQLKIQWQSRALV